MTTVFQQRREQLGIALDQLALLAGIEPSRLRAIEAGEAPFLDEQMGLARALGDEPSSFMQGAAAQPETRSAVRFRSAGQLHALSSMDLRLLARAAEAGRTCASLSEFTGRGRPPLVDYREVRSPSVTVEPWKDGYDLGASARDRLYPDRQPIVSVQAFLESKGVHVALVPFESSQIEAASLYEDLACPVVLLNANCGRVRTRLSRRAILAHELCHLLHDGGKRNLLTIVSRQDEQGEAIEQRANGFAPSFLVPAGWSTIEATEPVEIALELGERWGLSFGGAVWHAKNLGLIVPEVAEGLRRRSRVIPPQDFEEDVVRNLREGEPSVLAKGLFSDLAVAAFDAGAISRGRLHELLHFS